MRHRSLTSLLTVMFALFSLTISADEAFRNHRYSSFKALPLCQEGDIVFIGNSITNMMNWYEAFGSQQNIHGRGNSGGYTQEILDNLESMIAGNPSKVFLMIGTNDLGTAGDTYAPALVAQRIQLIISRIRTEAPGATVYYESILPSLNGNRTKEKTETTNGLVKAWIEKQNDNQIVYVDLYSRLAAANGALNNTTASASTTSFSWDGLHLTQKGYRVWMETIKEYVGQACVFPEAAENLWGGMTGSNGMRVTYFGALPVKSTDILIIGDEAIHNGEWHELLGSPDFKDRGIGWGFPSINIANVNAMLDPILTGNNTNGVTKEAPRAVCLYAGLTDIQSGTTPATAFASYQTLVNNVRTKLPDTPIFIMTVMPYASNNAEKAQNIVALNDRLKTLADNGNKIYIIDTYSTAYTTSRVEECFMGTGNIYLTGIGYARMAQEMAAVINEKLQTDYRAITSEEAQRNVTRFDIRTAAYGYTYESGTTLGCYEPDAVTAYNAAINDILNRFNTGEATSAECTSQITTAVNAIKTALVMPNNENAGETHEFQLYTPNRGYKYMTSTGRGKGVTGTSANNSQASRWKFLPREDGTWDIRNVSDRSYLSPEATYNTQIVTSKTVPDRGWEFSYSNTNGLYIIHCGTVQLNQTQQEALYNWSSGQSGTDRNDAGCQYRIVDVTDIPADSDEPVIYPTENIELIVNKDNGSLSRDGATSTSAWCNLWTANEGLVTFRASANNMQWNDKLIDARSGMNKNSTYTLSCHEDYIITGYTMTLTALSTNKQTWNIDGQTFETSSTTDPTTVTATELSTNTVNMTLTGENTGTLISDFKVNIRNKVSTLIVDTEHGAVTDGRWVAVNGNPQIVIYSNEEGAGVNTANNKLTLTRGTADATYRIEAPEGYVITEYEFRFLCPSDIMTVTPENEDPVEGSIDYAERVKVTYRTGVNKTFFRLSGPANGTVTLSDFYIQLQQADPEILLNERFTVFENPSPQNVPYRIPAIAKAQNGDLVAVADYRYSKADIGMSTNGKLDLRFRIKDHATGEWGEVQTLAAARGSGSSNIAFGDPCIVADRESNRIMVTSCCGNVSFPNGTHENHQGWARFYSEDGGHTWSDYTDISQQVFDQLDKRSDGNIRCFFIGSGKICQSTTVKVGSHYRLYCAALVKTSGNANVNYVFYSDDFGGNWHLLGQPDECPIPSGGDEPKAEELPDGSVLISSRTSGGRLYNIFHFTNTATGEGAWGQMATSNSSVSGITASSNACNGETLCIPVKRVSDNKKVFLLFQSVPFGPNDRSNVGINYKELADLNDFRTAADLACNWDGKMQATNLTSGYSTMTLDANNNVAFFYEENNSNSGYDMVYKKYSVEDITDGLYTYETMETTDSTAFLTAAINTYVAGMGHLYGSYVGQYSDEARTSIEAARAAYATTPGRASYEQFNYALANAKRVEVQPGRKYYFRNYGRSTETNTYVMSIKADKSQFVGANMTNAPVDQASQHFMFIATDNESEYLLYHPESELYYGKLDANETVTAPVSDTDQAGIFRIESETTGRSKFNNLNHTGSNLYIHLAGDLTRLVPWSGSDPSVWYIEEVAEPIPTDAFYRIKGFLNERYLTTGAAGAVMPMIEDGTTAASIFYLGSDNKLLNYANGLYAYNTSYTGAVGNANTWTFTANEDGTFYLQSNATGMGTYLYNYAKDSAKADQADRTSAVVGDNSKWKIEAVTALPVEVSEAGYATLFAPVAMEIPADVNVYTGTVNTEKSAIELTEINGVIPANTPVLVQAAAGIHHFTITEGHAAPVNDNDLVGTISTIATPENTYTLQNPNDNAGFYPYTGTNVNGFKAYLTLSADAGVSSLSFIFGGANAIENIISAESNKPVEIYDLAGRRVTKPVKGLYIVGGKKVIVK
ncbi:MAG: GDSL-type esterase/lipase family protein [Clostridium sp.]|nr:GDSL-type esterase/lipase family protein [Clostridium sp.]